MLLRRHFNNHLYGAKYKIDRALSPYYQRNVYLHLNYTTLDIVSKYLSNVAKNFTMAITLEASRPLTKEARLFLKNRQL